MSITEKMKEKYLELYKRAMELRKKTGWGRLKIARELGISENTVGNWLYPKGKGKKYHRDWEREHRITTTGHKKLVGSKRPYPQYQVCELCKRRKRKLLDYHHYDDNNLSKGLWLCRWCHPFAENVDKGFTVPEIRAMGLTYVGKRLMAKYIKLKSSILKVK